MTTRIYWETYEREGRDPRTGTVVSTLRRRVKVDRELPAGDEYEQLILARLRPRDRG